MNNTINSHLPSSTASTTSYPSSIAVPALALPACLLCIPPLFTLSRARNLPAVILVTGVAIVNLQNFINALIWPNDPLEDRWNGKGLCDVEVKLYIGIGIAIVGAAASIFRQLAVILSSNTTTATFDKIHRYRSLAFELVFCIGLPIYLMTIHYVVQPNRYWLVTISGCTPSFDSSWPSYVLVLMWPIIVAVVATAYCCLASFRLLRHRREVSNILSSSSSITRARYIRLFVLALLLLAAYLPLSIYTMVTNLQYPQYAYSWSAVHPPGWADSIERQPLHEDYNGFDRWVQIGTGYALFLFFGLGCEATAMYKLWWARLSSVEMLSKIIHWEPILNTKTSLFGRLRSGGQGSKRQIRKVDFVSHQNETMKSDLDSELELGILQSPRRF